jgi:hypothetical protein
MTDVLTRRDTPFWPRGAARLAGFLYLLVIVGGGFAEIGVRQQLVVANDPATTAANILALAAPSISSLQRSHQRRCRS